MTKPNHTDTHPLPRTWQEIAYRIGEIQNSDFFGAQAETLICALPYDQARPWLKPETTEADWAPTATVGQVRAAAVGYLEFAMGKADNHRSLSANRSIDHYRAWLWLLGKDAEVDWDNYPNYGAPILRRLAELLDATDVWQQHTTPGLDRMADGLPCDPDGCMEGCAA